VETVGDFLGEPGRTRENLGGPGWTWADLRNRDKFDVQCNA